MALSYGLLAAVLASRHLWYGERDLLPPLKGRQADPAVESPIEH